MEFEQNFFRGASQSERPTWACVRAERNQPLNAGARLGIFDVHDSEIFAAD